MSRNILITGATGRQGGAVINQLLQESSQTFTIYALTRTIDSASAQALAARSSAIKLVAGDLDTPSAVFDSISAPVWAVFSVQAGIGPGHDSRARGSPRKWPDRRFDRARRQVLHLRLGPARALGFAAILKYYIPAAKPVQYVACKDIGWFAAKALCDPDANRGRVITLAGDQLTFRQFADTFRETTGRPLPLPYFWWLVPSILFFFLKDLRTLFRYIAEDGQVVDISAVRKEHPEMQNFRDWLWSSDFVSR